MKELREFTKEDWYGYTGAEKFSDGSNPLVGYHQFKLGTNVAVICDKNQIDIAVDNDITEDEWTVTLNTPTEELGKFIASHIFTTIINCKTWSECKLVLAQSYGIDCKVSTPDIKLIRLGTYCISNTMSLEIFRNSEDDWFVKKNIEDADFEKVEFTWKNEVSGLIWGDMFINFNCVLVDDNGAITSYVKNDIEVIEEHYTPSSTAHDYSPSNPWDAPGMSIHDFI